jgi:hypothetical protein
MGGYILKRTLLAIPTLIGVTIGIFLMVRLLPGDIIDILFGGDLSASEEVKEQAREQLGLNGSYPEQYWRWISGVFRRLRLLARNSEPSRPSSSMRSRSRFELMIWRSDRDARRRAPRRPLGRQTGQRPRLRGARRRPRRGQHPELLAGHALAPVHLARVRLGAAINYASPLDDPIANLTSSSSPRSRSRCSRWRS